MSEILTPLNIELLRQDVETHRGDIACLDALIAEIVRWKHFCKIISDANADAEGTDCRSDWAVTEIERAEIIAVVDAL